MSTVWQIVRNVAFLQHCSMESKPRSTVSLLVDLHWQLFLIVPLHYQKRTPKKLKWSIPICGAISFCSALACLWVAPIRQRPHQCCSCNSVETWQQLSKAFSHALEQGKYSKPFPACTGRWGLTCTTFWNESLSSKENNCAGAESLGWFFIF